MHREGKDTGARCVVLNSFAVRALIFICLSEAYCFALKGEALNGGISRAGGVEATFRAGVSNPYGSSSASDGTAKPLKVTPGATRGVSRSRNVTEGERFRTAPGRGGTVLAVVYILRDAEEDRMLTGLTDPRAAGNKSPSPSRFIESENISPGDSNFVSSSPLPYGFGSTGRKEENHRSPSPLQNGSRSIVRKVPTERENSTQYSDRAGGVPVPSRHRAQGERSRAGKRVSVGKAVDSASTLKDGISANDTPAGVGEVKKVGEERRNQPTDNEKRDREEGTSFASSKEPKGVDLEGTKVGDGGFKGKESPIVPYFIVDAPLKKTPRVECEEGEVYFNGRCRKELN